VLNNTYATVWEPRIGFAYDVSGITAQWLGAGTGFTVFARTLAP